MSRSNCGVPREFAWISKALVVLVSQLAVASPLRAAELITPRYASTGSLPFIIGLLALGVLLGLLAYTIFLAISTRERMFIYFSIIMILLTVLQTFAAYNRFIFHLTYTRVTLITHLLFITFLVFFEDFFSLRTNAPRLSRWNKVSIYIIAGYTVFFLVMKFVLPESSPAHGPLNFIRELFVFYTNILFLYTIVRAIAWMRTEAILILVAFIPPAVLTSINAMNIFPFMRNYGHIVAFLMQYNQPIGLSLQAVLFSLAMGNRYNRIKLDRQRSYQESERLKKLDTEKTEFFMNMSHELRTPLTIILGMTQQLRQGKFGDSIRHNDRVLETIERNSLRLLKQVSHMLRMGKPRSNHNQEPLPVMSMLNMLVEEFRPIALQRDIRLTCVVESQVEQASITIACDDLEALVMNLLSNALKFTPPGGAVSIHASLEGNGDLLISVSDTGVGIDTNEQELIFDRYHSVLGATDQVQTGLGLALVKNIMEGYGGTVSVESRRGTGSCFHLVFPAAIVGLERKEKPPMVVKASRTGKLYTTDFTGEADTGSPCVEVPRNQDLQTILIVEDNADMRSYITSVVSEQYQAVPACSGEEGLQILDSTPIDLIISDIMMPGMDGHAFLTALKQRTADNPIPLVFLTARDSLEERIESLREGVVSYITKPFSTEMLLATIANTFAHDRELVGSKVERLRRGLDILLDEIEHPHVSDASEGFRGSLIRFSKDFAFSARETQVLSLILQGKSDKEIAIALDLSAKTVANHNRRIYQKARVNSRYELTSKVYAGTAR